MKRSFREFWPYYLGEHLDPLNRRLHVAGTLAAAAVIAAAIVVSPWLLLALPVVGYGPAWVGHFFIEQNRPASFGHPLWSLVADVRMAWFALTGRLPAEAARVGARCRF